MQHSSIGRFTFATLLVVLGLTPSAFAIDLSGDYVGFNLVSFTVHVMQTGTVLQASGHVHFQGAPYQFSANGTVDPSTGAFSVTGAIETLCADFAFDGTGDGEELTGTAIAHCINGTQGPGPFLLTKCGNGLIDPLESCETLAGSAADCCSAASCRWVPAGSACSKDGNECTEDTCDATGTCMHLPIPRATCRRCNDMCRRDIARCMATQCGTAGRAECRRMCKPPAIRTLAYALSECRQDAVGSMVMRQALRIRRGDRDPITVVELGPSGPVPDPRGVCASFGREWWGSASVAMFPLQRLGVSPDGSGVVFEVNDEFSIAAPSRLSSEQKGMFFVRADGSGLHKLGPASRDRSFTIGPDWGLSPDFWKLWVISPPILFSPNGRQIAFTDIGPGSDGGDTVQIFVLDLNGDLNGNRRQVTHLPSDTPPRSARDDSAPYFSTCCPRFIDNDTILFQTFADADGSNPKHDFTAFTVKIDGSGLTKVPAPPALPDSHLVPSFAVTGVGTNLARLAVSGTPVDPHPGLEFPIAEVFLQDRKNLVELTRFDRSDTFLGFLNPTRTRAFFLASADPLGTNPGGYCQIFSVNTRARGLRQVTHLDSQVCGQIGHSGCFSTNGIGYSYFRVVFQDPVTETIVFDSGCDLLGTQLARYQIFAVRPNGDGLRQLTDASGVTSGPDGVRVELPGPFAYSAPIH